MWTFIENKNKAPNGSGNENQSDQGRIKRRRYNGQTESYKISYEFQMFPGDRRKTNKETRF